MIAPPMAVGLFANSLSPFVRKVRITLYEKGADFDAIEIDRGAQRAELLRINPRGEVPALVDGDVVVTGSGAICDYLEETIPAPTLLPSDAAGRARCRTIERVADTHTDVLQFLLFLLAVRRPDLRDTHPTALPLLSAAIARHYAFLDDGLGGREWFVGTFSRADVSLFPHVSGLVQMGAPIPESHPRLGAWIGRMLSRPSVQRDAAQALAAFEASRTNDDPFFRADRIHWRGERVEWAMRIGLGDWLLREVEAGRAYFSSEPG
jgi:glutathione S-transferase